LRAAPLLAADELDRRLALQLERFDAARAELQARVAAGDAPLSRREWEARLRVADRDALQPHDLAALRARHATAIAHARERAARDSAIDLARVRAAGATAQFCRELPKGGLLHVHPHGTLDRATVRGLLERVNPRLDPSRLLARVPAAGTEEARARLAFLASHRPPARYRELSERDRLRVVDLFFWQQGTRSPQLAFAMIDVLRESPGFERAVYAQLFARASEHGVRYVELSKAFDPSDVARGRVERIGEWARAHGVVVRFNVGFARTRSEPRNYRRLAAWLAHGARPPVVGIDLYGREASASQLAAGQRLYPAVQRAREAGATRLQLTAHAAGEGDARNPRDALIMGAARLGHGVRLREDPVALEYARRRGVAIETNLTSNLRLRYVERLADHPFLDFLRLGLPVSLSTDDEGMLETDISRECGLAVDGSDIHYAELRSLMIHSLATSFAEEPVKAALLSQLEADLRAHEQRWLDLLRRGARAGPFSPPSPRARPRASRARAPTPRASSRARGAAPSAR
jgi:hypothetical protein